MRKWLLLLACVWLALPASGAEGVVREGKGWLERVSGLPVVHLAGGPKEMGLQHGRLLTPEIRQVIQAYLYGNLLKRQGYTKEYLASCTAAMLPHIRPSYLEEMRGIAEGAGVPYEEVLWLNCHAEIVHYGKGLKSPAGTAAAPPGEVAHQCSNLIVFGPASAGGRLYHGRNLDWGGAGIQPYACVLVYRPGEGRPFALAGWAGSAGGVTGMNADGLTMGEMTSESADRTLDAVPLFFLHRDVLQHCRTLAEATSLIERAPHSTGWNLMVGDGKIPDGRAYEVSARAVKVYEANDPRENDPPVAMGIPGLIRRTNHFIDREMQAGQARKYRITNIGAARLGLPLMDTGLRYSLLGRLVRESYGKVDAAKCRQILATPPVACDGNLHSVVMAPSTGEMWVANATLTEPAWKQRSVRLNLRRAWTGGSGAP